MLMFRVGSSQTISAPVHLYGRGRDHANNEGQGYVLRRLLRRAARHGKLLGIQGNFLRIWWMKWFCFPAKPSQSLLTGRTTHQEDHFREEDRFNKPFDQGLSILKALIRAILETAEASWQGTKAFRLYGHYGFPLDPDQRNIRKKNCKRGQPSEVK